MSDKLPSLDDFTESELPSVEEFLKEEETVELPSVEEFVEEEVEDVIIKRMDARWNSFDGYVTDGESPDRETQQQYHIDDIYHLHFTSLSSQIWHPKYSPHGKSSYRRKDIAHVLWKYVYKIRQLQDYL